MRAPLPRLLPHLVAALIAAAVVLLGIDQPLVEDGLFWWVPKALWLVERGPAWSPAGELPDAVAVPLGDVAVPQWAAGLPDWDHPPLWVHWLALFLAVSPTVQAVHLACLPVAVLAAVGWVKVAEALGRPWAGLAPLCLPPVLAQLLRPDLDLPLLAVVPWALWALLSRRWRTFAVLGLLAPWCKEPGVILAGPALLAALHASRDDRDGRGLRVLAALTPLFGLGLWALIHGGLANPESLPRSVAHYVENLLVMGRITFVEQGRFLLLPGLLLLARALWRRRSSADTERSVVLAVFVGTWLFFFAAVGFFSTLDRDHAYTHVRYFLPGLAALSVLACRQLPPLAAPGLLFLFARSPFGPEASLWGLQVAQVERTAAPWIAEQAAAAGGRGGEVWVGSYQAAGLRMPWAGIVEAPVEGIRAYAEATPWREGPPLGPVEGALVLTTAYGEPTGALERGRVLAPVRAWEEGDAWVRAWAIGAVRPPEPGETAPRTSPPR